MASLARRLADDREVAVQGEDHHESVAEKGVVVSDENADWTHVRVEKLRG